LAFLLKSALSDKYFISYTEKQENKDAKGGKDDTESNNAKGGKDDLEIKNAEGGDNPESEKTVRKLICKQLNTNVLLIS
jgi:DNA polymerase III delta subunit